MEPVKEKGIIATLKEHWFLIIFIGSIVVSWTTFSISMESLKDRVTSLEAKAERAAEIQNEINVRLGRIETDIGWVRAALAEKQK